MPELKAANHLLVSLFYWTVGEGKVSWNPKFWEPLITSPQGFSFLLLRAQSFLECWATFNNKLWIHLPSKWSVFAVCACVLSQFICVQLSVIPWTIYCQALLSMGFSGQEYQSGLLCPSPGDLSDPGIKPESLTSAALAGGFFTISTNGKPLKTFYCHFGWINKYCFTVTYDPV